MPNTELSSPALPPRSQLTEDTGDVMVLHTQDAYRLFTGQSGDLDAGVPAISGGRRFAAVMKSIWYLSANDNPYADWILLRAYQTLLEIRTQMAAAVAAREAELALLRDKGLRLSVLSAQRPAIVSLDFRSPYGYATAEAIVEFDHYVRLVRTLVGKDRVSDVEGRAAIRTTGRRLRRLFLEPVRWERHLRSEALRSLSRHDFLPEADAAEKQRVRAAVALFGEVPSAVLRGSEAPRHSQRRAAATWPLPLRLPDVRGATSADGDLAAGSRAALSMG